MAVPDVQEIIELWKERGVKGLRLAELLWQFSETQDASIYQLQQAFIDRGMAPPDPPTISRHITVWGEWVVRRKAPIEVLEKIGIDRLYQMRRVPLEQSEEYLQKALTLSHKEFMKALGRDRPAMHLKLDSSLREIVESTFEQIRQTLRETMKDPDFDLSDSQVMEFICSIAVSMEPNKLLAIWRTFIGEAELEDYFLAKKALGFLKE